MLIAFGVLAMAPVGLLFAYELDRFGTEIAELAEAAAPRGPGDRVPLMQDPALDSDRTISEFLGGRHHAVDRVRQQRRAAERVNTAMRLGFVLAWGLAFLAQAGLGRVVLRALDDQLAPGLWIVREVWRGVRRGLGSALLASAVFSASAFLVVAWRGPLVSALLPLVVLTMGFVAAYVAVPARVVESAGWRAAVSKSAELTKRHRVLLFFLWAGAVVVHLLVLMAGPEMTATRDLLTDPSTGQGLLTPHRAVGLAWWILATGAVIPPVGALMACVAHHRLLELRRPSKVEQMTGAFD